MTNDFRCYNVIYIVYNRKNENYWSLLITRYSLLITRNTSKTISDALGSFYLSHICIACTSENTETLINLIILRHCY